MFKMPLGLLGVVLLIVGAGFFIGAGVAYTKVQDAARDMAWSGTTHALVAELDVGAATHSTLQLALGVAALLAGLGVVFSTMGIALVVYTRQKNGAATPPSVQDGASVRDSADDLEAAVV